MSNEYANAIRTEPLEDAILRVAKQFEICATDRDNVYSTDAKLTYEEAAEKIKTVLSGEYVIGWENNNANIGWIPCELKMPEDCEQNKDKKIIDVLVTTDKGRVTKVQRILNPYNGWYWGRVHCGIRAWMPLPKPYTLYGI